MTVPMCRLHAISKFRAAGKWITTIPLLFCFAALTQLSFGQEVESDATSGLVSIPHKVVSDLVPPCDRRSLGAQNYVTIHLAQVDAHKRWSAGDRHVLADLILVGTSAGGRGHVEHKQTRGIKMQRSRPEFPNTMHWIHKAPLTHALLTIHVTLLPSKIKDQFRNSMKELASDIADEVTGIMFGDIAELFSETSRRLSKALTDDSDITRSSRHLLRTSVTLPGRDGSWCVGYHAVFGARNPNRFVPYVEGETVWDSRMEDLLWCRYEDECSPIANVTYVVLYIETSEWYYSPILSALDSGRLWSHDYRYVLTRANKMADSAVSMDRVEEDMVVIGDYLYKANRLLMEDYTIVIEEREEIHKRVEEIVQQRKWDAWLRVATAE